MDIILSFNSHPFFIWLYDVIACALVLAAVLACSEPESTEVSYVYCSYY